MILEKQTVKRVGLLSGVGEQIYALLFGTNDNLRSRKADFHG